MRPALVRAALSAPRRRPTGQKLYGIAATLQPGDEIITAALVPRAGATAPPAGSWYHVFWAQKPVPRPADYTDIAGARVESGRRVQIPIRGDRGWYYVQVVGPSGAGFVTTKSNRLKVPSVPEPQMAAEAGRPKIAVRLREIRIPGESERAIEVTAPRSEIYWDEWEVRVDGKYHSRHETDFSQGTVIRLDPGISGRVTVIGTLDQRPVTRESNPVRFRPTTAPPTATPRKVARSDRRFFGQAA